VAHWCERAAGQQGIGQRGLLQQPVAVALGRGQPYLVQAGTEPGQVEHELAIIAGGVVAGKGASGGYARAGPALGIGAGFAHLGVVWAGQAGLHGYAPDSDAPPWPGPEPAPEPARGSGCSPTTPTPGWPTVWPPTCATPTAERCGFTNLPKPLTSTRSSWQPGSKDTRSELDQRTTFGGLRPGGSRHCLLSLDSGQGQAVSGHLRLAALGDVEPRLGIKLRRLLAGVGENQLLARTVLGRLLGWLRRFGDRYQSTKRDLVSGRILRHRICGSLASWLAGLSERSYTQIRVGVLSRRSG
jgi:hypothetical protein